MLIKFFVTEELYLKSDNFPIIPKYCPVLWIYQNILLVLNTFWLLSWLQTSFFPACCQLENKDLDLADSR